VLQRAKSIESRDIEQAKAKNQQASSFRLWSIALGNIKPLRLFRDRKLNVGLVIHCNMARRILWRVGSSVMEFVISLWLCLFGVFFCPRPLIC